MARLHTDLPYLFFGKGRPDTPSTTGGVVTGIEAVGAVYRSIDGGGVGAWGWTKESRPSQAGNGWEPAMGDTGWRYVVKNGVPQTGYNPPGAEYLTGGRLRIRRTADVLWVSFDDLQWSGAINNELHILGGLGQAWQVADTPYPGEVFNPEGDNVVMEGPTLRAMAPSGRLQDIRVYPAYSKWPTTLPAAAW